MTFTPFQTANNEYAFPEETSETHQSALDAHCVEPFFDTEQDYKIYQLELRYQECLESLENHERRLIALEGKNANGRH